MDIMKLLENLTRFLHIRAYEQKADYFNELHELTLKYDGLIKDYDDCDAELKKADEYSDKLEDDILELELNNIHSSLDSYNKWAKKNIEPKKQYYDFGSGRKQPHTIFANSLKDHHEIWRFVVKDIDFDGDKYNSVDSMVYGFNVAFSYKYKTRKYYSSEIDLYGVAEFWALAIKTIEKLRAGVKAFDCDDSMVLRYACLYLLIEEHYPTEIYRLRGFVVDLWTGGGHAMLGWLREDGINDWIPLETTFYNDKQSIMWNRKYVIRNQILYKIRYSFDNKTEYVKI